MQKISYFAFKFDLGVSISGKVLSLLWLETSLITDEESSHTIQFVKVLIASTGSTGFNTMLCKSIESAVRLRPLNLIILSGSKFKQTFIKI
jgi:hypothetical protein